MKRTNIFIRISNTTHRMLFQSSFWRNRIIRPYLSTHEIARLQIGCGPYRLDGWLNTDIDIEACKAGALYLDAGEAFPFPDNTFDCIYSEHLFEHLRHEQAVNMLRECHRVLKPAGTIRIATPDFHFLEDLYLHPEKPLNRRYIDWSASGGGGGRPMPPDALHVINKFHTSWGHRIIYDRETLTKMLEEHGFANVRSCETGRSSVPELNNVEAHFNYLPYDFYQLETMILEAGKA